MTDNFKQTISNVKQLRLAQEDRGGDLYPWTTFDTAMVGILEKYVQATSSRDSGTGELGDQSKIHLFCFILERFFDLSFSSQDNIDYIFLAEKYISKFKQQFSQEGQAYFYGLPRPTNASHFIREEVIESNKWKVDAAQK